MKNKGFKCLVLLMQYHKKKIDIEEISKKFSIENKGDLSIEEIKKLAKDVNLKAKLKKVKYSELEKENLPVMTKLNSGEYILIAKKQKEKILIMNPNKKAPESLSKDELENIWNNEIITFKKRGFDFSDVKFGIKWFIPVILKYKEYFIETLTATFLMQILGLAFPLVIQVIVDKVFVHKSITTLNTLVIGLTLMVVVETILRIAKNYIFVHTTNKIDVILGSRLFQHLFNLPLSYFESRKVGVTVSRVKQLENIREFLTGKPLTTLLELMFVGVYLFVMFLYSPLLTGIIVLSFPIFVLLGAIVMPLFRENLNEKFQRSAEKQSYLVEAISGSQAVKSFAIEPSLQKRWEKLESKYAASNFKTNILSNIFSSGSRFIQKSINLLVLWGGAYLVISKRLTVGELIAFRMLSTRVSQPILGIVNLWHKFQQMRISINKLGDILNTRPEVNRKSKPKHLSHIKGKVTFKDIHFRYKVNSQKVLNNVSLEISSNSVVGIVGRSGSGKSTLAKLLQRLYLPENGQVYIDNMDLNKVNLPWIRKQIGVVLQENYLYNLSVRDNIAIHMPSASTNRVIQAAKLAGAHEFILELPDGYDTKVGEKGNSLSGGQKQRVAIARALISDPRILIFDEATSALDYESEAIIQKNLEMICKNRTVIMIAHRLSTVKDADKIVVMEKGEIIETGNHRELIQLDGMYKYLHDKQSI